MWWGGEGMTLREARLGPGPAPPLWPDKLQVLDLGLQVGPLRASLSRSSPQDLSAQVSQPPPPSGTCLPLGGS